MSPIPASPGELIPSLQRRLNDIRSYQIPRLRGCKSSVGLQRELAEEVRGDLEVVRRGIETCRELGELLPPESRNDNDRVCYEMDVEYRQLRSEYRQAILVSKKAIASSRRYELSSERDRDRVASDGQKGDTGTAGESSRAQGHGQSPTSMEDDTLQTRTNEVTDALRRTTQVMQAELEKSVLSVQMLEDSTRTLRSTLNLYDTYTSLLRTSSTIIRQLEKADWYDRLTIFAAFAFFLLCVGWVIKRRVLDRLVGGVGWWVGGSFKLIGMGLGLGSGSGSGSRSVQGVGEKALGGRSAAAGGKGVVVNPDLITSRGGGLSGVEIISPDSGTGAADQIELEPKAQGDRETKASWSRSGDEALESIFDAVVPPSRETVADSAVSLTLEEDGELEVGMDEEVREGLPISAEGVEQVQVQIQMRDEL